MKKLILASESPYRRELLERLGVPFETHPAHIDEDSYKEKISDIHELTEELAKTKALKVLESHPDAIVIGSDQALGLKGEIFSKPGDIGRACEQLQKLAGRTHSLVTSVCLASIEGLIEFSNTTKLTVRKLSDEEILDYVKTDMPLNCAGSYKIEGAGIRLFSHIEMDDFTSIIGLPLIRLTTELKKLGF